MKYRLTSYYYPIFTAILSIMYGIMFSITPLYGDDAVYLENSVGEPGTWDYFLTTVATSFQHWQWDTGRLCNMIATPFLSLFPKIVYSIISALAIWIIYMGGPVLTQSGYNSYNALFWLCVTTFIFPWFDFMFSIIFSINYVWTCAIAIVFMFFFIRYDLKNITPRKKVLLFILSFALGWWHEGLSVPLAVSILLYFIIRKKYPSKERGMMLYGLICGIIMIMLMPAFWNSTQHRVSVLFKPVLWETLLGFAFIGLYYIYLGVLFITLISSRKRFCLRTDNRRLLALYVSIAIFGLMSSVIYVKYYSGPRAGCFIQMASAMGLMSITNIFHKKSLFFSRHIIRHFITSLVIMLCFVNLCVSVTTQTKITKECNDLKKLYNHAKESGMDVVFYDPSPRKFSLDFYKASHKALNTAEGLSYILFDKKLLPNAFKDFNISDLKQCSSSNLFIFSNHIVSKGNKPNKSQVIRLKTSDRNIISSQVFYWEFKDRQGHIWTYIQTKAQTFDPNLQIIDAYWETH